MGLGTAPVPLWRKTPEPTRIARRRPGTRFWVLVLAGDLAVIWLSFITAHWIRYSSGLFLWRLPLHAPHFWVLTGISLAWLVIFSIGRLYRGELVGRGLDQALALSKSVSLGVLLLLLAGFATRTQYFLEGRLVVALAWVLCTLSLSAYRLAVVRPLYEIVTRAKARPLRFLVVGTGSAGREMVTRLQSRAEPDLEPVGFLNDDATAIGHRIAGLPVLGASEMVELIAQEEQVDQIFISIPSPSTEEIVELVSRSTATGLPVRLISDSFRLLTGSPDVELVGGVPTVLLRRSDPSRAALTAKRVMDAMLAGALLLLISPLMGLIALMIRVFSGPPVIFRQTRAGHEGRPFRLFKFRTMSDEAGDTIHRSYANALISGKDLALRDNRSSERVFKPPEDPRVTTVGRMIRKTSLDELPQLLNVLRGEMSLVGPRPPILYELEYYKDWHRRRLSVRPGVTGLWQVYGRSRVPFDEMVWLDLCYIDNWSLIGDLSLLVRTVPVVLFGKGAY